MRINAINMLRQASRTMTRQGRSFGYDSTLEILAEHLEMVREGKASWEQFAEVYCLTERDRRAPAKVA